MIVAPDLIRGPAALSQRRQQAGSRLKAGMTNEGTRTTPLLFLVMLNLFQHPSRGKHRHCG
jgi:hypothetical protein